MLATTSSSRDLVRVPLIVRMPRRLRLRRNKADYEEVACNVLTDYEEMGTKCEKWVSIYLNNKPPILT